MMFPLLLYLFILTKIRAYQLSITSDGVIPNQGSFGVTIAFDDTSPDTDTDFIMVELYQGSNPRSASGNVTVMGQQSGEAVVAVQYTASLPAGASGVYLMATLYPISIVDDPTTPPYAAASPLYVTVVADGLTDCLAGSVVTSGATNESLRISPGTTLVAPSCGSYRLPVTLGVLRSNSYVLVNLVDSTNFIYATGKCKVRNGLKGSLSVPVTVVTDIPLDKDILTDLFLVNQTLFDSFPDEAIKENFSSQTGVLTDITQCPGSSPASAREKSLNWLQQNGYYIIGATVIVIAIALVIFCLHKKARARGTSIIFMIRKSTVASRKSQPRGARMSSVEMEQMSASKKEQEANMLQEPFSGFDDLQYPETQSPYSPAPSSPTQTPQQLSQKSPPPPPADEPEPSPPPMPQPPPPPPSQWEKVQDYEKGVEYYWNPATGATQWEKPEGF